MPSVYEQGRIAYAKGWPNSQNPYESGCGGGGMSQQRVEWFNGWYDEWRWQKYGPNEKEVYVPLRDVA